MIEVVHGTGWTSVVIDEVDEGVWVDWSHVEGEGAIRFIPQGEYVVIDASQSHTEQVEQALAVLEARKVTTSREDLDRLADSLSMEMRAKVDQLYQDAQGIKDDYIKRMVAVMQAMEGRE